MMAKCFEYVYCKDGEWPETVLCKTESQGLSAWGAKVLLSLTGARACKDLASQRLCYTYSIGSLFVITSEAFSLEPAFPH